MPRRVAAAALAVAVTGAGQSAAGAAESPLAPGAPVQTAVGPISSADRLLCSFDTDELGEVSGIALSQQHDDVLWMTNDSEGGPFLYAVATTNCRIRARLTLLDTPARDHEALAVGRDTAGNDVIWVADIGDNRGSWPYARIHKVMEPTELVDQSVPVTTYRFTYPDGPVDAEALIAAPKRERLWVVSKERGVAGVYRLPSPLSPSLTPMRAKRVGDARALVTDASMAPDGKRYVVRDYFSGEVFLGRPPGDAQARFALPLQPQGEAVTWTSDGSALMVASESSGELVEVDVPRTALGTDEGIAALLPRVAGFDIYPYVRIGVLVLAGLVGLLLVRRVLRRRARRRRPPQGDAQVLPWRHG